MSGDEIISRNELTRARLLEVYRQAYLDASLDEDEDIQVELDGYRVFAVVAPEQSLLRLWTAFSLRPEAAHEQVVELCNRINSELVMIRAAGATGPPPVLVLDYYVVTQAGLTGRQIVDVTRRFRSITDAVLPLDTDNLFPLEP